jgi:hypothetical protein
VAQAASRSAGKEAPAVQTDALALSAASLLTRPRPLQCLQTAAVEQLRLFRPTVKARPVMNMATVRFLTLLRW